MAYGTRQEVAEARRILTAAGAARVAAYRATLPRETLAHETFMHGNSCVRAGQFAAAMAALHQAQELNPKHPYAAERLAEGERQQQKTHAIRPITTPL